MSPMVTAAAPIARGPCRSRRAGSLRAARHARAACQRPAAVVRSSMGPEQLPAGAPGCGRVPRRALLTGLGVGLVSVLPASGALAADFTEFRREKNLEFLSAPVQATRVNILLAQAILQDTPAAELSFGTFAKMKKFVVLGAQDCLSDPPPADNAFGVIINAYSNIKDVCTLSIIKTSVTTGPAKQLVPKGDEGKALVAALGDSLDALKGKLDVLYDAISQAENGQPAAADSILPAVDAALGACDDYERKLRAVLGVDPEGIRGRELPEGAVSKALSL